MGTTTTPTTTTTSTTTTTISMIITTTSTKTTNMSMMSTMTTTDITTINMKRTTSRPMALLILNLTITSIIPIIIMDTTTEITMDTITEHQLWLSKQERQQSCTSSELTMLMDSKIYHALLTA